MKAMFRNFVNDLMMVNVLNAIYAEKNCHKKAVRRLYCLNICVYDIRRPTQHHLLGPLVRYLVTLAKLRLP